MTPIRVLYSFPHRIGAGRICYTAWHQVAGLVEAGADVTVLAASVHKPLPPEARVISTLSRGRYRIPYRAIGQLRALKLHDRIVASRLRRMAAHVDVVHAWPLGALETLKTARELGIPTVLERPNAHTRFAYEVVQAECERIGVRLPSDHEHAYNETVLAREEAEYAIADRLLCPSEFVAQTFQDQGTPAHKLARHYYGVDTERFHPARERRERSDGLTALFVGVGAVRKGLHFALAAWRSSPAARDGRFVIAGEVLPAYADYLAEDLADPSVTVLGHSEDVPALMRESDVLMLPSIEEGFGLVCTEAMASGCVPLVSDACTDLCIDGENALVHRAGQVDELRDQLTELYWNRNNLAALRAAGLRRAPEITWAAAGERLLAICEDLAGIRASAELARHG